VAQDLVTLKNNGFMRQKQKDCFSLRVAVVGGNLTSKNLATIAEVAEKYGDGHVHLTSRQSVEIPFIKLDEIEDVKEALAKGGVYPGSCGARVRTITACQGNRICGSGNIDSHEIASELDKRYFGKSLPHKFKMGVTGCQNNCLKAEENDIGIKGATVVKWKESSCVMCGACEKICRQSAIQIQKNKLTWDQDKCIYCGRCEKICPKGAWEGETGYWVSFGGLFGNRIHKGEQLIPVVTSKDQLYRVTDAAVEFFAKNAKPKERLQFTIERVGLEEFKNAILEAYYD